MPEIRFDPTATDFTPSNRNTNMPAQMSVPPASGYEARVLMLEEEHVHLRSEIKDLKELYHDLSASVDGLKQGGWPVHVGPFQDLNKSRQNARELKSELEKLAGEVQQSGNGITDGEKVNGNIPPHMRTTSVASNETTSTSVPPHLRGVKKEMAINRNDIQKHVSKGTANSRLVTDGLVDLAIRGPNPSKSVPGPPTPPATVMASDLQIKDKSPGKEWKPYHLRAMPPLTSTIRSEIPIAEAMVTFHPDFLHNTFDGIIWSPGLKYIPGPAPCMLKNRTYYLLDSKNEPFLPQYPGNNGAKLTAFFNRAPEEVYNDLEEDASSYEDVPMFIKQGARYVYFGNYSQTRWSDKLDVDSMRAGVPQYIKEYWAAELSAPLREKWVTEELKKHFFKKPEYEGRLYAVQDDETTVTSEEEAKLDNKMVKDVKKYVEELRDWEREANMRVAMIKKEFILEAFERADADDPPALRLWWEYLQCVDWRKDFYDLLVTLQSRQPQQYHH